MLRIQGMEIIIIKTNEYNCCINNNDDDGDNVVVVAPFPIKLFTKNQQKKKN